MDQEQIQKIYHSVFKDSNGKEVIRDLECFILTRQPFFSGDERVDALLREGARHLLNYIYTNIPNN